MEKVKAEIQEFFNLPVEEKRKFWQQPGQIEGFGQAFVVSEEQKLDWADLFFMVTLPPHLRKPHLFPKLPLPFRYWRRISLSLSLSLSLKYISSNKILEASSIDYTAWAYITQLVQCIALLKACSRTYLTFILPPLYQLCFKNGFIKGMIILIYLNF